MNNNDDDWLLDSSEADILWASLIRNFRCNDAQVGLSFHDSAEDNPIYIVNLITTGKDYGRCKTVRMNRSELMSYYYEELARREYSEK